MGELMDKVSWGVHRYGSSIVDGSIAGTIEGIAGGYVLSTSIRRMYDEKDGCIKQLRESRDGPELLFNFMRTSMRAGFHLAFGGLCALEAITGNYDSGVLVTNAASGLYETGRAIKKKFKKD